MIISCFAMCTKHHISVACCLLLRDYKIGVKVSVNDTHTKRAWGLEISMAFFETSYSWHF